MYRSSKRISHLSMLIWPTDASNVFVHQLSPSGEFNGDWGCLSDDSKAEHTCMFDYVTYSMLLVSMTFPYFDGVEVY